MPMDARDIEAMIKAAIPDAEVTIRDLAGDGDHYAATVISESFRGKSRVQQHQIVYQSLKGQMGGVLHALALQTGVPGGVASAGHGWGTRGQWWTSRAARCFACSCRTSTPASPMPSCSFDLVFVFAVTQLSHTLLHHFPPLGAVQVTVLFLAVWWVWVYTTWVTNWLNPEQTPVRLLLFVLMLGGLVAVDLDPGRLRRPGAVVRRDLCAAMQTGRTLFWLLATPRRRTAVRAQLRSASRPGCAARRVLWIAGGLRRARDAAGAVDRGADHRIRRAGGAVLDAGARRCPRWRPGRSRAAIWPSAAPASSSSRWVRPSSSTARPSPS